MIAKLYALLKKDWFGILLGGAFFIPALILDKLEVPVAALVLYILALVGAGYSVFIGAVRGIIRRDLLDERFLMSVSSIGAMFISEYSEGVAVMLFYLVGEFFQHRAVRRSRNAIRSLTALCPDSATVLEDGEEKEYDAEDVEPGMIVLIRPGERVAVDCKIIDGSAMADRSMLTGESIPVDCTVGDDLDSGCIVLQGTLKCRVLRSSEESCASRILELVENASERKSKEESFITRFSRVYTPIVCGLAVLMAVIPSVFNILDFTDALYRALSFLVVSCPCALVISVPMAFFGGIGGAASVGILYKGGNTFSPISRAEAVVFDKTGTLTRGVFTVTEVLPVGIGTERLKYLVSSAESGSLHPLSECLRSLCDDPTEPSDFTDLPGMGITAKVDGVRVGIGNARLMEHLGVSNLPDRSDGRLLVCADGAFVGTVTVSDTVKDGAAEAISRLKRLGVKRTYMLTGDAEDKARQVAAAVGIDEVHHSLMPADKFNRLEDIISNTKGSTVYIGDGINDAPSLARADVGIAMGGIGTDSAIEAADAVIVSDDLGRLSDMIKIARKTTRIAKENIVLALGIKLGVIALMGFGIGSMWLAVFADVGVAVLAILNSMRTLIVRK